MGETAVSMANVRLTAPHTPMGRLQPVFQSTMHTPLDIPTMLELLLELATATMVVTMESVKLNLTPLDRLLQVCPFTMPSLLDILTMLVLLLVMDMDTTDKLVL